MMSEKNKERIASAIHHIRILGELMERKINLGNLIPYMDDLEGTEVEITDQVCYELDEQLETVEREVKEANHRLFCDDCRGDEGLSA